MKKIKRNLGEKYRHRGENARMNISRGEIMKTKER